VATQVHFSAAPRVQRHRRRDAALFAVYFLLCGMVGCAASRPTFQPFWAQTPPPRHSTSSKESAKNVVKKQAPEEPAVAANVALNSTEGSETKSSPAAKNASRTKSSLPLTERRLVEYLVRTSTPSKESESLQSKESTMDSGADRERIDSALDRFSAALSEDLSFAETLPQESLTGLAEKLRIEALIVQAKQLLDSGQLEQAEQKAQQAQELSDTVEIDYAPDEDRPIDLVRRIQGQLEATRLKDGSRSDSGIVEAAAESIGEGTLAPSTQPDETSATSSSSLARIRRDWSTLFRQKKKSGNPEANPSTPSVVLNLPPPPVDPIEPDPVLSRAQTDSTEAVVMANRSVSLGAVESMSTSSASYVEATGQKPVEADSFRSDLQPISETTMQSLQESRDNASLDFGDTSRPVVDSAEAGEPVAEFDVGEMTEPAMKSKVPSRSRSKSEVSESSEATEESDRTGLYLGIGLFAVLAIGCFRRTTR
jgi:hypothetical protein